jgi:hypothetical protein
MAAEGRYALAIDHHRRALAIKTRALGDGHPRIAVTERALADALRAEAEPGERRGSRLGQGGR